jgi:hypothetical protein
MTTPLAGSQSTRDGLDYVEKLCTVKPPAQPFFLNFKNEHAQKT